MIGDFEAGALMKTASPFCVIALERVMNLRSLRGQQNPRPVASCSRRPVGDAESALQKARECCTPANASHSEAATASPVARLVKCRTRSRDSIVTSGQAILKRWLNIPAVNPTPAAPTGPQATIAPNGNGNGNGSRAVNRLSQV